LTDAVLPCQRLDLSLIHENYQLLKDEKQVTLHQTDRDTALARMIALAIQNKVDGFSRLRTDERVIEIRPGTQGEIRETIDGVPRALCVDRREGPPVAGIHGLQEVVAALIAYFAHDDAVTDVYMQEIPASVQSTINSINRELRKSGGSHHLGRKQAAITGTLVSSRRKVLKPLTQNDTNSLIGGSRMLPASA